MPARERVRARGRPAPRGSAGGAQGETKTHGHSVCLAVGLAERPTHQPTNPRINRSPERNQKTMFIAYEVSLELITSLRRVVPAIEQHDRDLGDQIRRAASSVSLN